jgi:hypothetical protein
VLCSAFDSYDTSGNDNTPANASVIYVNEASQTHNYCNPLAADYQSDEDWVKFGVILGENYFIFSQANSPQTASTISLFDQNGISLLAQATPMKFGDNTFLFWTSDRDSLVYARFHHLDKSVIGKDVTNIITVKTGDIIFLPIIQDK